ncbi:hypothetical protein JFK97_06725 [Chromobacterium phragmitis]|uniref:hypothetical protein n=1 Tax=Chromobacterium amazonense TaxID=1382803 RepID=UPI0021B74B42|nr:hypothetical protein [Chromobacterium amazonense]MBM2884081.1 hypothetical protein [Chromobacterium amazonense]
MADVYRVYLKDGTAQGNPVILAKSHTDDREIAAREFAALVNRTDLDGLRIAAVLSYNNRQIAYHRFDREPGHADCWRGRAEEIQWPE